MTERARALVQGHLKERPASLISDVYKLLYQSCMGPSHAILNSGDANTWLMQEWECIRPDEQEKLFEDMTIFHPVYRVNLRAAKARGIRSDKILRAFISCANEFPKNPDLFRSVWDDVAEAIRRGKISISNSDDVEEFNTFVKERDNPAMHHSEEYREAYGPAYRLVGGEL